MSRKYLEAAEQLRPNPGQWAAYESEGDCVVLAGPGSGKTKTLTVKLARIIAEDVEDPRGVACITYSNDCVAELRRRLGELGIEQGHKTFIGTVHSFCFTKLVLPYARLAGLDLPENPEIAPSSRQNLIFEQALQETLGPDENPNTWRIPMEQYRRVNLDRIVGESDDTRLPDLLDAYEAGLREEGLVDFDDIVIFGLRLIEGHQWVRDCIRAAFPVVVVDEYQDLGGALHRIVMALKEAGVRIFVVGDPDQSIYGFSGAQPRLLEELAVRDDLETVRLRFNYRSGALIVNTARQFIGEGRDAEAQQGYAGLIDFHYCENGLSHQASFICEDLIPSIQQRIPGLTLGEIAVLYPTRNQGDVFAEAATNAAIEFVRFDKGAPFEKTPLTKWILECARWCAGGWESGDPKLSEVIFSWQAFNRSIQNSEAEAESRRSLVRFLFDHRNPDIVLVSWLQDLEQACLSKLFGRESMIEDEMAAFCSLQTAAANNVNMVNMTVGIFSGQTGASDFLNMTTLHSAKGLEWKAVVMFGMDQGILPWNDEAEAKKRESRRLFYVGLTRAEREVHLTYSGWTKNRYGRRFQNGPSEFLLEVKERLQGTFPSLPPNAKNKPG